MNKKNHFLHARLLTDNKIKLDIYFSIKNLYDDEFVT